MNMKTKIKEILSMFQRNRIGYNDASDQILDLFGARNWIAVSKKLPKEVMPVLVYSECCEVCWYMAIAEIEEGKWFDSSTGEDVEVEPTHWAELPKPPLPLTNKTI